MTARLTLDGSDLILASPFHRGLVEELKTVIPYHDRQWDNTQKVWRVKYMWGNDVAGMVKRHLGENITVPNQVTKSADFVQTRLFRVEYIGSIRERDNGDMTATGFCNGGWNIIFPADTLTGWFNQEQKPDEAPTLYAVLGIKRNAAPEEIKKAYRISARTWHPDVNKEPDATAQFLKIQHAYEILSDETMRRKYNAGLMLERDANKTAAKQKRQIVDRHGWQPPIRCGQIAIEGTETLGRFLVKKILAWNPVTNEAGLTMVSYWPKGSENFVVEWL
jgi:hypothetical protein